MNAINFKRTLLAAIIGSSMAFGFVVSSNADARQPRDQQSGEDRPARGKQDEDAKAAQKREREVQKEVRAEQARTQTQQRQYREERPRPSREQAMPRDHDRLPEPRRQALIAEQRQQAAQFSRQAESRRADLERYGRNLQRQHRDSQYRYQQDYYDRMRRHHSRYDYRTYNYYNDPYFYAAPIYRYYRGGSYFSINIYGANLLQQAINFGYSEGLRAGRADRLDGWRFDYRSSYAYRDANYGYYGFYVSQAEYNYYFRRGFERGYEDGYYGRRRYGHHYNGADVMLAPAMSMIFNFHLH